MLPSGLPERVADEEELSRFLTQSNLFKGDIVKPAAFLPSPKHRNTSVFRTGEDRQRWQAAWTAAQGERELKAVAIVQTAEIRLASLDVFAQEPPLRHANIERWPWLDHDLEMQKAAQKELAAVIASKARAVGV